MTPKQGERLIAVLERIAASLDAAPTAPPVEKPVGCQHPEKARVHFGAMADAGGTDEWECAVARGGCGYRTPALVASGG